MSKNKDLWEDSKKALTALIEYFDNPENKNHFEYSEQLAILTQLIRALSMISDKEKSINKDQTNGR